MEQTYEQYRERVVERIRKKLGGAFKFELDELVIEDSFSNHHHYSVPADCLVEGALEEAREVDGGSR